MGNRTKSQLPQSEDLNEKAVAREKKEKMAAKLGSFRYNLVDKSKQRFLLQKGEYSEIGLGSMESIDGGTKCWCFRSFGDSIEKSWKGLQDLVVKVWDFGRSDPRKIIFSAKMGLALVIITLLIFWDVPVKDLTKYSVWAILTVVLVFEFSIGATFNKGFNRGLGTLSAGGLALGIAKLSVMSGKWEEVVIVISIFFAGFFATFMKLYPEMRQYEYGFRVFLLTYCFILVSGCTMAEFIRTAITRFLLILIGAAVSLLVNICIYPIWAGEDLHNLVVKNFNAVASSLEGCVNGYVQCVDYERIPSNTADGSLYKSYMSAVESTSQEDTLEGFAIWEPPHGRYNRFNYPWKNYVKLSGALRHCAFMVMALHGCILSEIQAPPERRQVFSSELQRVGTEGAKVLHELGNKVKKMEKLNLADDILFEVHWAAEELQKKIDQKSYLLVNAENWEFRKRPKDLLNMKDGKKELVGIKPISETFLNFRSGTLSRSWNDRNTDISAKSLLPEGLRSEVIFKKQISWPEHRSFSSDAALKEEEESKTYESASVLSLVTFVSLLIEFVARLQSLVEVFEELSEVAKFKEPIVEPSSETEVVGFWTRFFRCFGVKN